MNANFYFPIGEGFGINTNILETNVINLAVVIGVLVYFGGDILTSSLESRNGRILKSLRDAEAKIEQSVAAYAQANAELTQACEKEITITENGLKKRIARGKCFLANAAAKVKSLKSTQIDAIQLTKVKASLELGSKFNKLAIVGAQGKIQKRVSDKPVLQKDLTDTIIRLFSEINN